MRRALAVSLALLLCPACSGTDEAGSGSGAPAADAAPRRADAGVAPRPDAAPRGDAVRQGACGKGVYPCGPYGTGDDSIIQNLSWKGFADPDHLCKPVSKQVVDTKTVRDLSLRAYHQQARICGKKAAKRILWLFTSAGWCHACEYQVQQLVPTVKKGAIDKRVEIMTIFFQDASYKPATTASARAYARRENLPWPVAADPSGSTWKYAPMRATPFNMVIDLRTMKIIHRVNGADLRGIGSRINSYLRKNP